ncbi:MAG: hypothetical protein GYA31_01415 [Parcubacteria group bacterium]|nr:hypothetical protein [Parcubacteria group bacterium]
MKKIKGIALTNWGSKKFEVYTDSDMTTTQIVEIIRERLRDLDPRFSNCTIAIQKIQENISPPKNIEKISKKVI